MVLVLSRQDVESILDMKETMGAVEEGFRQLALGTVKMPLRPSISLEDYGGLHLVMPAYVGGMKALGLKVVTVYPKNPEKYNLPTILATVLLHEAETGRLLAIMDGASITAMRTGAVSGVATKYLARKDSKVAGIFGAGVQARTQLWAICEARDVEEARVYDVDPASSKKYCEEMGEKLGIDVFMVDDPRDAVVGSDVIATATTSREPVFRGEWVGEGTHINGVGSYTPTMRELDEVIVRRSRVVVDSREAALEEAGDLIIPISQGLITADHIYAELGEIVAGEKRGRVSDDEITLFKSVGLALQDVSTAVRLFELAQEMKVGKTVEI
ncbi:MAG: ornithine cyclodeaminase family protein [Candidatus Geothermarchaeales archaeon]